MNKRKQSPKKASPLVTKYLARPRDEPTMSDATLLVTVQDLIQLSFGPLTTNTVNFKMVQTILHILARQMRLLGQQVEIRLDDLDSEDEIVTKDKKERYSPSKGPKSSDKSKRDDVKEGDEVKKKDKKGDAAQKGEKTGKKDKNKDDKAEAKDRDKSAARGDKEQEKLTPREKAKAEKEALKEEKSMKKEKTRSGAMGKEGKDASRGRRDSGSSISISEVDRQNEKVLRVEKGRSKRTDSVTRVGSIEVVTHSQFAILEDAVEELMQRTGPMPPISLPENKKLRKDIAKGSASLTDTMQAMQVTARVRAAEQAIGRMTGLLTQLAAAGALPQDLLSKVADVKFDVDNLGEEVTPPAKSRPTTPGAGRKSVAIDPLLSMSSEPRVEGRPSSGSQRSTMAPTTRPSATSLVRPSILSRASFSSTPPVTHNEMSDAMEMMRLELMKNINTMTSKASTAAETASSTAKSVAERLDVAINLDKRITTLHSLVSDYADQLSGFDAGLTTSMQSFQEQMAQMRNDLKNGLSVMDQANNNGETAAVAELSARCSGLAGALERELLAHRDLARLHHQLAADLQSLVECVEMLREQKADRDEVLDGLRDKADRARLSGLLREERFLTARQSLEHRLHECYDKFQAQDLVWMGAIKELSDITEGKAEIMQLLGARDHAQQQLRDLDEKLYQLAIHMGEPEAALLTRRLARDASCGACAAPALMPPRDAAAARPPPLPALRPPPAPAPPPACLPRAPGTRAHICHRWVGGSHTLVGGAVTREPARAALLQASPTNHYVGYGDDGRLYMLEEELKPCAECNQLSTQVEGASVPTHVPPNLPQLVPPNVPPHVPDRSGAGDQGPRQATMLIQ